MSGQIEQFLRHEPDSGLHRLGRSVAEQSLALRPRHDPASGTTRPAATPTRVDLPAPFSPTTASTSPS